MIELLGLKEGQEFEAALHIRKLLLRWRPDLAHSRTDIVKIFVGLKLYGYKLEDLDLVVIGRFGEFLHFDVEYQFYPGEGEPFVPKGASVRNFALVVEVKSHDATGVRFEDKVASVRYWKQNEQIWECVTEKNRSQMFEFKKYLSDRGVDRMYVQDLVLFTGLRESDLPKRPHNCIGSDASFERILNVLGQQTHPRRNGQYASIIFGPDEAFDTVLSPTFPMFQVLEPTPLDRRRMDRIVKDALPDTWLDDLGHKQVLLRGRGGVGKTVILLQMAYRGYDQHQLRSLVLTFNKALVADMRRTMSLLGVPRSLEKGGISIETVHGFIGRLLLEFGVISNYHDFLIRYGEYKEVLLSCFKDGTITPADIRALISRRGDDFAWDLVFVDEGQDWPTDEIEILRAVYGTEHLVISDGVDQFVRDSVADWSNGVPRSAMKSRRLTRCLRMKSNLAKFVSEFASNLNLEDWDLEPNADAAGGRVLIVEGDLTAASAIIQELCSAAAAAGNSPVDMLACVPPRMADKDGGPSEPARHLVQQGMAIWDGTSRDVRENFPTDKNALRFVQYDSCRGLEGWTVINYGFDELWDYKYKQWLSEDHEPTGLFDDPVELASQNAARWMMIPLTRAMDTLVLNVSAGPSQIKNVLRKVAANRSDFVEWIQLQRN